MPISDGIEEIHLDTAHDFLNSIAPWSLHWGRYGGADCWLFRGQRDADWGLEPTAMRPGAFPDPGDPTKRLAPVSVQEQRIAEDRAVSEFVAACDRAGLALPEDSQWYRSPELISSAFKLGTEAAPAAYANQPFPIWRSLYALAQHHGVPTSLLDWSQSPLVSAYFACKGLAKDPALIGTGSGRLALWGVSRSLCNITKRLDWETKIGEVTAPYACNPNLRAQRGAFTLVYRTKEPAASDWRLPNLDSMVRAAGKAGNPNFMPRLLVKITLPHTQAAYLLSLLNDANVNAATIFPGYDGAVEAVTERQHYPKTVPNP